MDKKLALLVTEDLARSGITPETQKAAGIVPLTAEGVRKRLPKSLKHEGMLLPYYGLDGQATGFFRIRYLGQLPGKKPPRYVQPPGVVGVYFPPPLDWQAIAANVKEPVVITEGEKKALRLAQDTVACIGLGGVAMWRSTRLGVSFLPALEEVAWAKRPVYIVFDSDVRTNVQVATQCLALAKELVARGAQVRVVVLEAGFEGKKVGVDDYLVAQGLEAFQKLLERAECYSASEALWNLSEEVVYVRDPGMVLVRATGQVLRGAQFVAEAYANRHHVEFDGAKPRRVCTAKAWLEWPSRSEVPGITYEPGAEQTTADGRWNTWHGWGCEPKRASVAPWKAFLDRVLRAATPTERRWFEAWLAYPIAYPGTKLLSACVLWGRETGTGKTLLAYTMGRVYGQKNFSEIKNKDLEGAFNAWGAHKQFVYGDEIEAGAENKKLSAGYLKGLITQAHITVNKKFAPTYTIPDTVNYLFSSNEPDALQIDQKDRRFFVLEVPGPKLDVAFRDEYLAWLDTEGPSALLYHFQNQDLSFFDPRAEPPRTEAKVEMASLSLSAPERWLADVRAGALRLSDWFKHVELLSAEELLSEYSTHTGDRRLRANGMSRALKREGFTQVHRTKLADGTFPRLWALWNGEKWLKATAAQCVQHRRLLGGGK